MTYTILIVEDEYLVKMCIRDRIYGIMFLKEAQLFKNVKEDASG